MIRKLLRILSWFRNTPEGKIAEALIRANNPEKAAIAAMVLKHMEKKNDADNSEAG